MPNKIPYVISKAHPDHRRPYLSQQFGTVEEDEIDLFFIEEVSEFILEREYINTINHVDDIDLFWKNYYDEYYMDNLPWEAIIFIYGKWKSVIPTNELIFKHIMAIKNGEKSRKQYIIDNEEFKFDKVFEWEQEYEEEQYEEEEQEDHDYDDNTIEK
jgi:hypothetical protein